MSLLEKRSSQRDHGIACSRKAPFLSAVLLLIGAGLPALLSSARPGLAQAPQGVQDLSPEHSVSLILTAGAVAALKLDASNGQAEEIVLQTAAPGVSFRFVSSGGLQIQSGQVATAGWRIIPLATADQEETLLLGLAGHGGGELPVGVRVQRRGIPLSAVKAHARAAADYAAAESLRMSLRGQDAARAITKYADAAAAWASSGDSYGAAIALGGAAESCAELSRYSEATRMLDRAMRLDPKNEYLHAWLAHLKARVFLDQWETKAAKLSAEQSLKLGAGLNEPALTAEALADRAEAGFLTRDKEAESDAERALSLARSSGLPETAAYSLRAQAWIAEDRGHISRALSLMAQAEANFRQVDDSRRILQTAADTVTIKRLAGDDYEALTRYSELMRQIRNSGNVVDYGILLENMGDVYVNLNRLTVARDYFRRAGSAFSASHFRSGESLIDGRVCIVELAFDELRDAAANCERSVDIAAETGDRKRIAIARFRLGQVYRRMALADRNKGIGPRATLEDERALNVFKMAAEISHSVDDKHWEAQERISLGEVLEDLGDRQAARSEFESAKDLSSGGEDAAGVLEAEYRIARWYAVGGQYELADNVLKPALEQIEDTRRSVSDRVLQASYFAAERKCYALAVDLRMHEFHRDRAPVDNAEGLERSEAGRARSILDALAARTAVQEASRDAPDPGLRRSKMDLDQAFDRRLRLLVEGGDKNELEASSTQLTEALSTLEQTEDDERPAAAPLAARSGRVMSANEIEAASARLGETYFEYALGETRSYLWIIDQGRVTSHMLPPREQLEEMIKRWRAYATSANPPSGPRRLEQRTPEDDVRGFRDLSARLSCALLGNWVDPRMSRMVIVPDGDLAMLPFAALPEGACNSGSRPPLVLSHEIVTTPSLSVYLSQKARSADRFRGEVAIVADPVFDPREIQAMHGNERTPAGRSSRERSTAIDPSLSRLPATGSEAVSIERVVGPDQAFVALGLDASLNTILSAKMRDYRVWHLATHGVYDQSAPEFSGLVFSLVAPDGSPTFGFLNANDVEHLNLHTELVVLDACDSGVGEILSGEGVMGLKYAFLRAGARQVISALWKVDDSASKELMVHFYQEMMRNGNNAADALRKSQLFLMRQRARSSPYYWAGFELTSVGD